MPSGDCTHESRYVDQQTFVDRISALMARVLTQEFFMPTYEYGCRACGEHVDVVQSFHDDPLTVCPNCGGELRKVFRTVGIVFKGSGFYKTDSRAASSKSSESS